MNGNLLLARAEQSRLEGRSDPQRWRAAAVAWERIDWPFEAAYARFRQAEALLAAGSSRPQAEQALRSAHQTAVALGAAPLRREVESLAKRGRLRLDDHPDTAAVSKAPSPAASLGLTRRETEVLALVAKGRTNQQIGRELFITEGTAGVHVSRILAKLGVASRVEAAAIAHRLDLDKDDGVRASRYSGDRATSPGRQSDRPDEGRGIGLGALDNQYLGADHQIRRLVLYIHAVRLSAVYAAQVRSRVQPVSERPSGDGWWTATQTATDLSGQIAERPGRERRRPLYLADTRSRPGY